MMRFAWKKKQQKNHLKNRFIKGIKWKLLDSTSQPPDLNTIARTKKKMNIHQLEWIPLNHGGMQNRLYYNNKKSCCCMNVLLPFVFHWKVHQRLLFRIAKALPKVSILQKWLLQTPNFSCRGLATVVVVVAPYFSLWLSCWSICHGTDRLHLWQGRDASVTLPQETVTTVPMVMSLFYKYPRPCFLYSLCVCSENCKMIAELNFDLKGNHLRSISPKMIYCLNSTWKVSEDNSGRLLFHSHARKKIKTTTFCQTLKRSARSWPTSQTASSHSHWMLDPSFLKVFWSCEL